MKCEIQEFPKAMAEETGVSTCAVTYPRHLSRPFFEKAGLSLVRGKYGEQKTDKEISHKGIWRDGMPRERPGDKFGTSQGHPGRLGRFMWKFTFRGQNVRGTDGTCPRDRRDMSTGQMGHKPGCVPPKFFMFIGFSFPSKRSHRARNPEN